ncbi:hypothetical protein ACFQPA_12375 [Halomarina halobia]|uniref:DUF4013 domain-containing protein n=1 Tax=Halomarina halobia TaxID=3033386 RepID=A0ABD6A9W4_9EURY|nr:hypothetical protein [Halomarina sp. PSR21]
MLQALAAMMLVSVAVPLVWGEFWAIPSLLVGGLIPYLLGRVLSSHFADAPEPGKLHGMVIAASGWFFVALFGSLPFLFIAWTIYFNPGFLGAPDLTGRAASTVGAFRNPINAFSMTFTNFPVIKQVFESGADDRMYDSLVITGPVVVLIVAVVGRAVFTVGLAVLYLITFVSYLLYRAVYDRHVTV